MRNARGLHNLVLFQADDNHVKLLYLIIAKMTSEVIQSFMPTEYMICDHRVGLVGTIRTFDVSIHA